MTFMIISITISIMFMFLKHPLSMGLMLILQTLMIAIITGMMINTFWFSYILIISILSGALVLFVYMASVASNEKFFTSSSMTMFMLIMLVISFIMNFLVDQLSIVKMWSTSKMLENEQLTSLVKLFNMEYMFLTISIVIYLFITMIVVSNIVNVFEGPLRMKS
uniref:NADH-ubiquinone oxidoreductase chain 6 n=1 Tax=Polididus armatissimus TaxID=1524522 RepID=A0A9E8YCS0_9HEMI|nr:NADH dehydrogenase subunit 6 [Polididus armatissimus]WAJ48478.1 NADH dehydrogenase subunit 6 [Polididus armatissimus]